MFDYPVHIGYHIILTIHNDIYPSINPTISNLSPFSKLVPITGAGRGIGRSISLCYAEASVASLIICSRTLSELFTLETEILAIKPSIRVHKHVVDITSLEQVTAMVHAITKEECRLDGLIINAGVTNKWEYVIDADTDSYLRTWDVHIKGTYFMLKSFVPLLIRTAEKENGLVDVVDVTSIAAHFAQAGASADQGIKFALLRLAEFVDGEYVAKGVNCCSLLPGAAMTGIHQESNELVGSSKLPSVFLSPWRS